jgi:hypothetical protein
MFSCVPCTRPRSGPGGGRPSRRHLPGLALRCKWRLQMQRARLAILREAERRLGGIPGRAPPIQPCSAGVRHVEWCVCATGRVGAAHS